ncbi:MAG: type II toxin-antitoxin system HicA family toxin [Acidobacteriota bacterium]
MLAALRKAGFEIDHVTGSHHILRHPTQPGLRVTVPFHNKDLKRGTLAQIISQSGLSREEFLGLL